MQEKEKEEEREREGERNEGIKYVYSPHLASHQLRPPEVRRDEDE